MNNSSLLTHNSKLMMTKQNFWDNLETACPQEMAAFKKWIDEYKKKMNWDEFFNQDQFLVPDRLKYHHLPIAMQIGIFIQYCMETPHRYELLECLPPDMEKFATTIKAWMINEELMLMAADTDRPE